MSAVQRSILFSAAERYGGLLLFFASSAVLSRLLTPAEFGVYAVINAIIAVITASFQEFGGANYLIQKRDLSEQNVRTAFTITFCISLTVAVALILSTDMLVWFFKQDGLGRSMAISALSFALTPFSGVISALLRRDMAFGRLAICNLAANSIGAAVSIVLAIHHFSFMAPIWGGVAGNLALTIALIASSRSGRLFRPSFRGSSDVLKFGIYSGGISLINVFYNLAPQIFLARILDFASVGLYSRATGVTQVFDKLVGQVLGPVIMPAVFAETKAGATLKHIYLEAASLLAVVQWPFLAFLAIMAHPIILIWLGPTWLEIVPLVQLLCIANLALFAACLSYPVLVAAGRVQDALISSLISLPPSLVLIFAASFVSVQAVAASALLALPFQAAVAIYFISRHLNIRPKDMLLAVWKAAVVTLSASAPAIFCSIMVEYSLLRPLTGLLLACFASAGSWLLCSIVVDHPLVPRLQLAAGRLFSSTLLRFRVPAGRNAI